MLKDLTLPGSYKYSSKSEYNPLRFHLECLMNSNSLDLLLGYFSSGAIRLLAMGFASFIHRNGKIRLAINNILSKNDHELLENGFKNNISDDLIDISNLEELENKFSKYDIHFFECLAWLIANNRIEFVIISPKEGNGIAHYKEGVYCDGINKIAFSGSQNFTANGLTSNLESLVCFPSWNIGDSTRVEAMVKDVADIIEYKRCDIIEYLDIDQIKTVITSKFGNKELDELLVNEKELAESLEIVSGTPIYQQLRKRLDEQIEEYKSSPRFPYLQGPREYQINAYKNWVDNGYRGVFAMATGTGKTLTSLNCLLNEYKKTGIYRAIITVPTTALVEQWKKECTKFNFKNIITVSSKEIWERNLAFFNTASKLIDTSYIVIVTYASLPRPKFQSYFIQLPKDTILIADETHNLGSQTLLSLLPSIHLDKRIGLSATPHRKFDDVGNLAIQEFFNDKPPYIVSYSMEEALKIGWLCNYTYYPHIVKLREQEMEKYKEISLQLLRMGLFDKETSTFRSTPEIEKKLLERKRIIHKAANKLEAFKEILRSEFDKRKNLKYTLVYVPEGVESNFEQTDYSIETEDESKLINEYTKAVSQTDESVRVKQFTANSSNREEILKNFEQSNIHVLTSMKCLDEGVDVPRSELAIFCASTGNPRQFIQRRGRVLRLHDDKIHATIHDLVVVPEVADESTFEMEKSLVKKELERVVDFANLAMNKTDTYEILKSILDYYNLNLNDL